jgi:hypothetical protein
MAKPTVKVEVAWTDGPYVASPTWSDITTYVRSVSTSRGRTDDWQNFDSGSATLVLDNRDRRFDPTYTAGPNYGNLQPRRQIRVTADAGTGSGYVALFRGFVDGWPVRLSQAGFDSTVTITAYETLGLIAQDQVPADWSDDYILNTLAPKHYWKLDKTVTPSEIPQTSGALAAYTFTDYGTSPAPAILQTAAIPLANTEPLAPGIIARGIQYPAGSQVIQTPDTAPTESANTFSTATWGIISEGLYGALPEVCSLGIYSTAGATPQYVAFTFRYDVPNKRFEVTIWRTVPSSVGRVYYFPSGLDITIPHHYAMTATITDAVTPTATVAVYLDGQPITAGTNAASTATAVVATRNFFASRASSAQQVIYHEGTIYTATQIQTLYSLGNNVLTETTAARFSRIIAQTPLPAAQYSVTASPAGTVGRLTVGGAFVNNELQLANDSEGGELYTTKAGVLTMTNRTWYQSGTSATSQATFGSGGIPIQTEIEYAWNADNIRNTLDVSWSGDAVVTVSDSTSRSTYGVMQDSWTTALSTYADAQTLGNLLVGFGKLPRLVISAVELGQALSAANWNTVLGLELLDRITVVVPEPVGSNLSQTQIIQQIEHEITPGDWTTRILGSARWSSVFTIGTSYLDGTDILG